MATVCYGERMKELVKSVFDHADFRIVVKPAGVNFHSESSASGFVVQCQQQWSEETLLPVHRLDKMTSGLVILAKSQQAARHFEGLFRQREMEKYYLALSAHKPKKKQGWVKGDMVPARRGSWKLLRSQQNPAITQFISKPLQDCEKMPKSPVLPGQQALRAFLLKPHTGKTHQLRVAMKSLGVPILGDARYAMAKEAVQMDRGYLHAFALQFAWQSTAVQVVCPSRLTMENNLYACLLEQSYWQDWQSPWSIFK